MEIERDCMIKKTSQFNCPPRGSRVVFAIFLASAFAASNSSPADHKGEVAGNSTPGISDSLPRDIRSRIEQEPTENPALISQDNKQLTSRPGLGVTSPNPDIGVTSPNVETDKPKIAALPASPEARNVDEVSQYLWKVY